MYTGYGMSFVIQFEKNKPALMTFDRVVWKNQNEDSQYFEESHRDPKIQKIE